MVMSPLQLRSERLVLRKFTSADTQALHMLLKDEEVNTFLPWFAHRSMEETQVYLQDKFLRYHDKMNCYQYAICLQATSQVIGYIQIGEDDSHDLGYGLMRTYWHQGIISEACRMLLEQLKKDEFPYITATHDILNPRSGGVMQNIGMTYQYSYEECVQPKKQMVIFRLYQMNIYGEHPTYRAYWEKYPHHFIEKNV